MYNTSEGERCGLFLLILGIDGDDRLFKQILEVLEIYSGKSRGIGVLWI